MHARLRHDLFRAQGTEEIGRNDALGASVIRVPRRRLHLVERALRRSGYFKSVERENFASATQTPNDPDFGDQWGLPKIGVPAAWNVTRGSSGVIVAVVDSGIDPSHPDLQGQLLAGYDFVNNDADPSDDNGHGTRMAGIVAAETFNGVGIAGIAPNCRLLPVKVLGSDGQGAYSTIANGITYAADQGARVINLSLAGTADSAVLQSAVDYAAARGCVVVAAAGNYGTGDPAYPAAYANAVAVTASDENDTIASFSNHGSWVSLAAPGVNIMTTNWSAGGTFPYAGSSGTSPAAAFTSGAVALLFSAHPEFSNTQAVSALTASAHDVGSSGWDPYAGWGRVDIGAALGVNSAAPTPAPTPPAPTGDRAAPSASILSPASDSLVWGNTNVDVAATDDIGVTRVDLLVDNRIVASDSAPPFSFAWDATSASAGKHLLQVRAYDATGRQAASKSTRVEVTQGVGLSVKHARLSIPASPNRGAGLSVTAIFALPDGVALDQPQSSFGVTLSSGRGAILSTAAQSNALVADSHGRMRLTTKTATASGAILKVVVNKPHKQPTYSLTITATGLSGANADTPMSLSVNINGATLSQSLPFRLRGKGYMFP